MTPLTDEPNVPDTVAQVIACADGGQVVGAMTAGTDTATLCVQDRTRASAACAALDFAGWRAMRDLADEMMGRLAAR